MFFTSSLPFPGRTKSLGEGLKQSVGVHHPGLDLGARREGGDRCVTSIVRIKIHGDEICLQGTV
jgi:hypothetical protein